MEGHMITRICRRGSLCGALVATLLIFIAAPVHAAIIRVTTTGATSGACGSTWAAACDFHYGLDVVAQGGDEIWVMTGTYLPSPTDVFASFHLRNNITVYGG